MSSLVHIVPQLPPAIDGVGDYCWNLWRYWPEPQPGWSFLAAYEAAQTRARFPEVRVEPFDLNADSLLAALERSGASTAFLHYVGYAYQPKGIPVWLPGALRRWKEQANGRAPRRLVVMFHETYARSSPLRSPFWVAPFARQILRQLVRLNDAWLTNCERYFDQLLREFGARAEKGRILPVGSNVPLVAARSPVNADVRQRIVIFGLARTRLWALARHEKWLRALADAGLVEHVTLLGKSNEPEEERELAAFKARIGASLSWRERFDLSFTELSQELSVHDLGLLANEPDVLTKSGVFAALATHGVVPVVAAGSRRLPARFADAVIANDDTLPGIANISRQLTDAGQGLRRREQLARLAESDLSWASITAGVRGVIEAGSRRPSTPRAARSERAELAGAPQA